MAVGRCVLGGSDQIKPMHQVGKEGGSCRSASSRQSFMESLVFQDRNGLVLVVNGEVIGCGVTVTVLGLIDLFQVACGFVLCEHL